MKTLHRAVLFTALLFCAGATLSTSAHSAPFTPRSDTEIVERLPLTSDPSARQLESLRRQLAARPDDAALRLDIGKRYFNLALAQGDPRLIGYASAAIAPLAAQAVDRADYWVLRGQLQQYSHEFEPALTSLAKASQLAPADPEPLSWRAAIFMVQARQAEARAECERLIPLAEPLWGAGCLAYAQAAAGELKLSFDNLSATVKAALASKKVPAPEMMVWSYTRLAEMAIRLQRNDLAEKYFKNAFESGVTDQFLLGAYADFLLAQRRPQDVLKVLAGWERSDILLLRLAMAGRAANDPRAADWTAQLSDRFQAAAQRGDRLHEQEAARFELDVLGQPARALALATTNYAVQKEPRDAEILMRSALAANQARAAQPALDWLRTSRYEDATLEGLATQLAQHGAQR
jgi:hypothetical protein